MINFKLKTIIIQNKQTSKIKSQIITFKWYRFNKMLILLLIQVVKRDISFLRKLPVSAVFLTHPNKDADINVILGVNEDKLDLKKHKNHLNKFL